ncbi:hypothetical protein [uncultured Robinsoniella sp.]
MHVPLCGIFVPNPDT